MNEDNKKLLIKDLCSKLPNGLKLQVNLIYGDNGHKEGLYNADLDSIDSNGFCSVTYYTEKNKKGLDWNFTIDEIKPYLRKLSSMTEEEQLDLRQKTGAKFYSNHICFPWFDECSYEYDWTSVFEWLDSHFFDYRGLIEKGLALEAPKDMYK